MPLRCPNADPLVRTLYLLWLEVRKLKSVIKTWDVIFVLPKHAWISTSIKWFISRQLQTAAVILLRALDWSLMVFEQVSKSSALTMDS
ncbi:hypothetical protein HUJ05_001005 [Dendroctonus ponderosae]|nr:hypothetical protein HUJ05_001005 [Dendroctonus ponderosae]